MDFEEFRNYCLKKPGVTESFPFNEETLVFKVCSKMFCLSNLNPPININLKCDPEKAIDLREENDEIKPGYHMNKKHWNTVELEGTLTNKLLAELIDHSYQLVVQNLNKKEKGSLYIDN